MDKATKEKNDQLLTHLWRGGTLSQYWTGCNRRSQWFELNGHIPEAIEGESTYFSVHPSLIIPPKNSRGEIKEQTYVRTQKEYVAAINCLYGEFDHDIKMPGVPPASVVVESSPGHYHKYWLLDKPFVIRDSSDLAKMDDIQKRWVEFVGSDPGAKDLARVLRLPGYMNKKDKYKGEDGTFPTVDSVAADFEWTYTIDHLEEMLPEPVKPERKTSATSQMGDVREAYNRANEIEATAGKYLNGYTKAGKGIWSRPGDKNSAGAKIQGDKLHIYSSNDPLHPSMNGSAQAYDSFELFTHFEHNGDGKAAWTEAKKSLDMWEDRQPPIPEPPAIDDEPAWMAAIPQNGHEPVHGVQDMLSAQSSKWSKPLLWDDLLNIKPIEWEVNKVFASGDQLGMIYGPSGEGKTFVAIDLMISLIKGDGKWANRFAIKRPMHVLYATGEGFNGVPARIFAAIDHHELAPTRNLSVYDDIPQLRGEVNDGHAMSFVNAQLQLQANGAPPVDVVILDTLHNASVGADENSNMEMGVVIAEAKKIAKLLGCLVLIIHHTGKNGEYRGASVMKGDMNFMMEVNKDKSHHNLKWYKTKDGENWGTVKFTLADSPARNTVHVSWSEPEAIAEQMKTDAVRDVCEEIIKDYDGACNITTLKSVAKKRLDAKEIGITRRVCDARIDDMIEKGTFGEKEGEKRARLIYITE